MNANEMSTDNFSREFVFKIVVLGDSAVGKTSLINMYVDQTFQADYKPTLGANIIRKDVSIENTKTRLILWDLAGQEKYNIVRSLYFQGCVAALLVFDITRHNTFDSVGSKWLKDFQKFVKRKASFILIGNKRDLEDKRVISPEEGQKLARELNAIEYIETSALKGENVEKAFVNLVRQILVDQG